MSAEEEKMTKENGEDDKEKESLSADIEEEENTKNEEELEEGEDKEERVAGRMGVIRRIVRHLGMKRTSESSVRCGRRLNA